MLGVRGPCSPTTSHAPESHVAQAAPARGINETDPDTATAWPSGPSPCPFTPPEMAESRVTSVAAEVLATPVSQARVTSVPAEVATAASEARVSAIALEALVSVVEVSGAAYLVPQRRHRHDLGA